MWLCRFVTGVVPTLLFAMLLWGFLARFAPDPELSVVGEAASPRDALVVADR